MPLTSIFAESPRIRWPGIEPRPAPSERAAREAVE
jgi:hypothetical protein